MAPRCLYQATAGELSILISQDGLIRELRRSYDELIGGDLDRREVESWRESIPTVVDLLVEADLAEVQVLVELKTPISDVRMDMVLVGSHPDDGQMSLVVVENKQWSSAEPGPVPELVYVPRTRGSKPYAHPIKQVWDYRQVLIDYIPLVQRAAKVHCVVNMHNATSANLATIRPSSVGLKYDPTLVRMYCADHREHFKSTLRAVLTPEKAAHYAQELLEAPVLPTESLMTVVSESVCRRSVFPLLDEQRDAYEYVRAAVAASKQGAPKEVVLIVGGPGTGKSVIAVELLGTLNRQGVRAVHATGSKSFTLTLRDSVKKVSERASRSFSYFNSYTHATAQNIDVLICDEAHRIRETSDRRRNAHGGNDDGRQGRPQVQELIDAATVPVFLLDEHQLVRRGEVGSIELIRDAANAMGVRVQQIDLRHQFRCGGCPEYVTWIEQLLGLDWEHGPQLWQPLDTFQLYVAGTPSVMEDFLRAKQADGYSARIGAGFCWPWSDPLADGTLADDVQIGDWHRPWNSRADGETNGIPPSSLWATHPAGFGQIGCIYTAQGFEYDYAGVIFGNDLIWTGQDWQANRRANKDKEVHGAPRFGELVRNTYRVLATRGMSGAVLHSTDPATNRLFADLGVPGL
ncbi:ATP-binding protein [Acrocarpospora pleiomorpha]|uniref:ATP-binding protein n=1 Tax=Acrocarpospora pleiomorpha TaxID=90975 RepID=A0A5M3XNX5_9ACTN|nr:DNA/RNA helicase domain-containing protein [Acrocarpospora pleiomorpha]GES23047.1 ATP-binding protein [Acrocarpospora pleiomorpha]